MTNEDEKNIEKQTYSLDEQVGYLLRLASQRHSVIFLQQISENLTPTQFSTLIRISEGGELSQNHLGRLASMDVATVKGVVDRLKAKELIQSRADTDDKRRSLISLSTKGHDLVDALKKDGARISEITLAPLRNFERKTLINLLMKIS
ncbi:MAG: MarR family transcriptional regulator [Proteobacteria bacterium]|jgi:MarR family transcriptional regulator, lower aerobic nicotinate degradation pathway regulator|nr:MarR family transcriptional regulator [Pseudomonadota bacterium]MDA1043279.1 MarR family transcriptional regulator [Pseudomonadota bacterium]|tara:strand:+ start:251 stop:694 length:444 start_codon:yes stop_codon:yes gene_type:complete